MPDTGGPVGYHCQRREAKASAATFLGQANVDRDAQFAALHDACMADLAIREAIEKRAVAFVPDLPLEDRSRLAEAIDDRVRRAMDRSGWSDNQFFPLPFSLPLCRKLEFANVVAELARLAHHRFQFRLGRYVARVNPEVGHARICADEP